MLQDPVVVMVPMPMQVAASNTNPLLQIKRVVVPAASSFKTA
jgi:hypothetical protein